MNRLLLVIDHYPAAAHHPYYDSRIWLCSAFQTCLLVVSFGLRFHYYVTSSSLYAKVGGWICLQKQHCACSLSFFSFLCLSFPLSNLYPFSTLSCPPLPILLTIKTQRHSIHPGIILLTASCSLFSSPYPLSFHADCPSFVGLFQ